jgi:hypothetical protein
VVTGDRKVSVYFSFIQIWLVRQDFGSGCIYLCTFRQPYITDLFPTYYSFLAVLRAVIFLPALPSALCRRVYKNNIEATEEL